MTEKEGTPCVTAAPREKAKDNSILPADRSAVNTKYWLDPIPEVLRGKRISTAGNSFCKVNGKQKLEVLKAELQDILIDMLSAVDPDHLGRIKSDFVAEVRRRRFKAIEGGLSGRIKRQYRESTTC